MCVQDDTLFTPLLLISRSGSESAWKESKHRSSDGEDAEERDSLKVKRV